MATQFLDWLGGLLRFDLGKSYISKAEIAPQIADRLQVSLILVAVSMLVALVIAVPFGTFMAVHHQRPAGLVLSAISPDRSGRPWPSSPAFCSSPSSRYSSGGCRPGWTPPAYDPGLFLKLLLPALSLGLVQGAVLTRYVRSAVLDVLREDFLRTARAKGLTPMRALAWHGPRNAAVPVVTVLGLQLATLLVGAVVIERVFVIPGLGSLLLDAVGNRDLIVVQDVVMVLVVAVLVTNFVVDLLYLVIDPGCGRGPDDQPLLARGRGGAVPARQAGSPGWPPGLLPAWIAALPRRGQRDHRGWRGHRRAHRRRRPSLAGLDALRPGHDRPHLAAAAVLQRALARHRQVRPRRPVAHHGRVTHHPRGRRCRCRRGCDRRRLLGILSAMVPKWWGEVIMRANDLLLAFPALLLAIMLTAVQGQGVVTAMIAIGIASIPSFARVVRSGAIGVMKTEYVLAARAAGRRPWAIALRHVLPNVMNLVIVQASVSFAIAVLAEAALSYLGLGAPPRHPVMGPDAPGRPGVAFVAPRLEVFPGVAIALAVLGFNLPRRRAAGPLRPRLRDGR
ncbi:MAG: ABC transporter permease subunit [Actinomycetales bacterium]|nr:ABC transporter permease subunit [Actinomycetales bacterium]